MKLITTPSTGPCSICNRVGTPTEGAFSPLSPRSIFLDALSFQYICESCILSERNLHVLRNKLPN